MLIISDAPQIWFYMRPRITLLGILSSRKETDRWSGWFYFNSFSLSPIRGWQLSHEQAGACITANERQWVCTLITFQQPLDKDGWEKKGGRKQEKQKEKNWAREVRVEQIFLSMVMLTLSLHYYFSELILNKSFYFTATSNWTAQAVLAICLFPTMLFKTTLKIKMTQQS